MNRSLPLIALLLGLATVCWVGAGYVATNPLALAVTLLIAAFYIAGALELRHFQQATSSLAQALGALPQDTTSPGLAAWIGRLHPSLHNAVRLRIEGERVGLPGPAMAPYLAGLLVLLGMLGTFLGMVVTLNGTGAALDGATDLETIRASLSAPVKGLGLAFGTSVAGVAASAMLGLATALCRRDRLQAAQGLDARIATTLRGFSQAHRREESLRLQQQQAELMPALVDRLQAMMATLEQQHHQLNERLLASQDRFHGQAEAAYTTLAVSVDRALKESLTEGARVAGATIRPVVEATMAGIARETTALHEGIEHSVQRQLEGLSTRLEASTTTVAEIWKGALAEHQHSSQALSAELRGVLQDFGQTFTQRSSELVEGVAARLDTTVGQLSTTWGQALAQHERTSAKLSADAQQALVAASTTFAEHSAALLQGVGQAHGDLQAQVASQDAARLAAWRESLQGMAGALQQEWQQAGAHAMGQHKEIIDTLAQQQRASAQLSGDMQQALSAAATTFEQRAAALLQTVGEAHAALQTQVASRDAERLAAWTASLQAMAASLQHEWQQAGAQATGQHREILDTLAHQQRATAQLSGDTQQALAAAASTFEQHAAALVQQVGEAHGNLQTQMAARDTARLAAWTEALASMAGALQQEWQQAGAQTASQQRAICDTLAQTARDMSAQTEAHAKNTIAEIAVLVQTASEAPRAAAEVIGELRQKLSDSMVRDNSLLEERSRILGTLETLLGAINHASTEQRAAIDALVAASDDLLQRAGVRFTEQVDAEAGRMTEVAAQLTGSAVEVASLGEAFGTAVQLFGQSSDKLGNQLQRIEAALGKSLARSDEQLAYYVAQAREVIDLSILSQKQIMDDLQQLASQRATADNA